MNMKEQLMLSDKVQAFLNERRFAVLATIGKDGVPHQTVMWYALEGDRIMMNTARGRVKDKHLQRDQRASVCVEDGYRYVTLTGTVELNDHQAIAQPDIVGLARRYERDNAEHMIANFQQQERVTLRLQTEDVITSGFDE
jgi:PPOX class probable F420-dependent enzyme